MKYISLHKQTPLTVVLNEQTDSNFTRYIHGPTGILAQQNPNGDMRWLLQDGLQSVRGVSDGVSMLSAQAYSPYGEPLSPDLPTEFGFTGEMTDSANDLVYLRARVMNPRLGIFGSLDPFEGESSSPLTMNGYSWVEGNTPNRVDANGMKSDCSTPSVNLSPIVACFHNATDIGQDCDDAGSPYGIAGNHGRARGSSAYKYPSPMQWETYYRIVDASYSRFYRAYSSRMTLVGVLAVALAPVLIVAADVTIGLIEGAIGTAGNTAPSPFWKRARDFVNQLGDVAKDFVQYVIKETALNITKDIVTDTDTDTEENQAEECSRNIRKIVRIPYSVTPKSIVDNASSMLTRYATAPFHASEMVISRHDTECIASEMLSVSRIGLYNFTFSRWDGKGGINSESYYGYNHRDLINHFVLVDGHHRFIAWMYLLSVGLTPLTAAPSFNFQGIPRMPIPWQFVVFT